MAELCMTGFFIICLFAVGTGLTILACILCFDGFFDISCWDYLEGSLKILLGVFLAVGAILCFTGSRNLSNNYTETPHYSEEYESITDRLETNPFDKEAIHDAILYNHKVAAAKELDDLGSKNEYEDYINEPEIDFDKYQINYIDENFDLKELMEKLENKKEQCQWHHLDRW